MRTQVRGKLRLRTRVSGNLRLRTQVSRNLPRPLLRRVSATSATCGAVQRVRFLPALRRVRFFAGSPMRASSWRSRERDFYRVLSEPHQRQYGSPPPM